MIFDINYILTIKYVGAFIVLFIIIMTPAWLARQTKKNKQDMILVRMGSWVFGWTIIGWLYALVLAIKK